MVGRRGFYRSFRFLGAHGASGLGFRVWGLGFRVRFQSFGFRMSPALASGSGGLSLRGGRAARRPGRSV